MRTPDSAFVNQLKMMDKRMEVWWSDRYKKWMIISRVLPNGARCERPVKGITEYDPIQGFHFVVLRVLEEHGRPLELDGRVIRALWILKQGREVKLDAALRKVDQEELERTKSYDKEHKDGLKQFTKWGNKLLTSKTFS